MNPKTPSVTMNPSLSMISPISRKVDMTPTKVFLDLDDVCNAFTMYALQAVGCPVNAFDHHKYNPEWGFDIVQAANGLHPTGDFTTDSFWNLIDRSVWANAPVSMELELLLHECKKLVGYKNVHILTTPIMDPECLAGKLEWIHENLPPWLHRRYLMTPRKYLLAQPGALLIDDSDRNVDTFCAAGGDAILVPRPWNSLHEIDTKAYLIGIFMDYHNIRLSMELR